jgi:hypothetical protein
MVKTDEFGRQEINIYLGVPFLDKYLKNRRERNEVEAVTEPQTPVIAQVQATGISPDIHNEIQQLRGNLPGKVQETGASTPDQPGVNAKTGEQHKAAVTERA